MAPSPPGAGWQGRLPFYYGWLIVGLGFFSAFFGIGLTWAASLFAVPMRDELGWDNSGFFFAVSLRGWMGIVIMPMIGPYFDLRHGVRILAAIGAVINVVTLILISGVNAEWQFILLFGVLGGVAQSCQAGTGIIVTKWFIRKRGLAVTLASAGGGLAALIMPPLLIGLDSAVGWRASWQVVAVLAFVFSALPVVFLRRQPEDIGLLPDGDEAPVESTGEARGQQEVSFTRREALHTRTFWILMVGIGVGALAANGLPANLTNMFVERGLDFDTAAIALVAYGIASMLAKVVWGLLANRLPLRSVLLLLTAYGALGIPTILLVPNSIGAPALVYGFIVGFYVGAYIPLHFLVWAAFFGRMHVGAISSVGRPFGAILLSGGPFVMAFTFDVFDTYTVGLLLFAVAVGFAFVCLYFLPMPRRPSVEEDAAKLPMVAG